MHFMCEHSSRFEKTHCIQVLLTMATTTTRNESPTQAARRSTLSHWLSGWDGCEGAAVSWMPGMLRS